MANDNHGPILTGALFAAGGVGGYLAGRWLARRFVSKTEEGAGATNSSPRLLPAPRQSAPAGAGGGSTERPAWAGPGLSREFDAIFERHRGDIPIEYLRALAT